MQQQRFDERAAAADEARATRSGSPRRATSFGGFDIGRTSGRRSRSPTEERTAIFEDALRKGGFHFWGGTFPDILFDERANATAYEFWRDKTRARIDDPAVADKLAPAEPPHPFGTKRPSLEQHYFEVVQPGQRGPGRPAAEPIERIDGSARAHRPPASTSWTSSCSPPGFDAVTGGLTAIDIRGTRGDTLGDKWANGVRTHLGVASHDFPNLLFLYGPQSPSGFCNGPTCAELQGDWVVELVCHMLERGLTRIEATSPRGGGLARARARGRRPSRSSRAPTPGTWAPTFPGKPREMLTYPGGVPLYLERWDEFKARGYDGFALA